MYQAERQMYQEKIAFLEREKQLLGELVRRSGLQITSIFGLLNCKT